MFILSFIASSITDCKLWPVSALQESFKCEEKWKSSRCSGETVGKMEQKKSETDCRSYGFSKLHLRF